jgi:protein-tyrosine phosphatase
MTGNDRAIRVLFVCTGNICRSPTAEGLFRALVERAELGGVIEVDSAGTGGWHVGEPPDGRSQAAARQRGLDLSGQRARQVETADFEVFDYLLGLDRSHLQALERLAPAARRDRLHLLLDYAPELGVSDVPDPYYGGVHGFEQVLDLVEAGCRGLLDHIRRHDLTAV